MQKNSLLKQNEQIIRVLDIEDENVFIIDCIKRSMPKWMNPSAILNFKSCTQDELLKATNMKLPVVDSLSPNDKKKMNERYSLIAYVLPFVNDEKMRSMVIHKIAKDKGISVQIIRYYLCLYLVYQDKTILAPIYKKLNLKKELTQDEKNMRWALNKFYYTRHQHSLATAYTLMLKEKYCDALGELLPKYPSIHQFRYFYKKTKKHQTYYISRDGIKSYQRNNRPLLGEGVQTFAPNVGTGMLDATVCDIYLVNDTGNLVGRPILTVCVDAYSRLCCGYSLTWEGGFYSLRNLMLNVISDKVEWCKKHGINISCDEWNCNQLPAILVTDMGSEYKSEIFEQITDIGVQIVNLPPYRPELKGIVEKFFDVIQEMYKKYLKGKGVIEVDFLERGGHDYRKDACLTLEDFEKILLYCIIYYNTQRILENYPYTDAMIKENVKPYANCIYEWGKSQIGANLISVSIQELVYTLLPRTQGKFTRFGLKVNKMRYKHENFAERYLDGKYVTVAYNPEDVSNIWLIENGAYIKFDLIESRYNGKGLLEVELLKEQQKEIIKQEVNNNLQAQIYLAEHIQAIANSVVKSEDKKIKDIRKNRKNEQMRTHLDSMRGGVFND